MIHTKFISVYASNQNDSAYVGVIVIILIANFKYRQPIASASGNTSAQFVPSRGPTGRCAGDACAQSVPSRCPVRVRIVCAAHAPAQSGPSGSPTRYRRGGMVDGAAQSVTGPSPVVCPVGPLSRPSVFLVQTPPGAQLGCPVSARRMPDWGPVSAQHKCWLGC